jgi:hypothetical protein
MKIGVKPPGAAELVADEELVGVAEGEAPAAKVIVLEPPPAAEDQPGPTNM